MAQNARGSSRSTTTARKATTTRTTETRAQAPRGYNGVMKALKEAVNASKDPMLLMRSIALGVRERQAELREELKAGAGKGGAKGGNAGKGAGKGGRKATGRSTGTRIAARGSRSTSGAADTTPTRQQSIRRNTRGAGRGRRQTTETPAIHANTIEGIETGDTAGI